MQKVWLEKGTKTVFPKDDDGCKWFLDAVFSRSPHSGGLAEIKQRYHQSGDVPKRWPAYAPKSGEVPNLCHVRRGIARALQDPVGSQKLLEGPATWPSPSARVQKIACQGL